MGKRPRFNTLPHTPHMPTLDSHMSTTQLLLISSPSVKLTLKPTQLSSTTLMEPTDLYTHTLPPMLDTHTPLVTPTAPHIFTILESVKPTAMPLFTTKPTDTTTDLHILTAMVPHTPTTPSHTEMFTDGTELLRRT